jgi:hypothetical protein
MSIELVSQHLVSSKMHHDTALTITGLVKKVGSIKENQQASEAREGVGTCNK